MAGRGRNQTGPKGLCAYLVEVQERDGITSVPERFSYLVRKCIEDKVFSENRDHIAVCRTDNTSAGIQFGPANWDGLRKGLRSLNTCEVTGAESPVSCLDKIVDAIIDQTKEDSYDEKKIIYFADLGSYIFMEDELVRLVDRLTRNDIFMSVILPNKDTRTDLQIENSKLLKKVLKMELYEDMMVATSLNAAVCQIVNTQSKRATRPSPWNCPLEISPEITINVSGFVCTRKNKVGEMTRVLMKQVDSETGQTSSMSSSQHPRLLPNTQQPTSSTSANSATNASQPASLAVESANKQDKTVLVEEARKVVEKEHVWMENDGNIVPEEDIGKAYYFGDKLIPFNAEMLFKALLEAMVNTNRIAVVRKVYLKDKKLSVGTLVPDTKRQCLVFSELCYADDVSIPQLPILIRQEELENEIAETNEKEELIDRIINLKTIDDFHPSNGPVDPAVSALRERISRRILGDSVTIESVECSKVDPLAVFFESKTASANGDASEVLLQIKNSFPLRENTIDGQRFAGKNVFRKREPEALPDPQAEKKPKLEIDDSGEANGQEQEENADEMDDLLNAL